MIQPKLYKPLPIIATDMRKYHTFDLDDISLSFPVSLSYLKGKQDNLEFSLKKSRICW